MRSNFHPTLRQVFGLSLLGLLAGLALLFYLVFSSSQQTILQSSERYRELASREVVRRVTTYLAEAPMAVAVFEQKVKYGLIDLKKPDSVEQSLLSLLLANENISEATLTYADNRAYGEKGTGHADPNLSGQIAILRSATDGEFVRKLTWYDREGQRFVSQSAILPRGASAWVSNEPVPDMDPTVHPTFQMAATKDYGNLISTDLHWSQVDEMLPEAQRRVELSVQKTIEDNHGQFAGVVRIGLMKSQIDGAVQQHITGPQEPDPHLIFICDNEGRLITGFGDWNRVAVSDDDLRIPTNDAPPAVIRALQEPALKNVAINQSVATSFSLKNRVYLCSFEALPKTQDWIVGIVVPRDFYLGALRKTQFHVLEALLALIAAIIAFGVFIIHSVVKAQSLILRETALMNSFKFLPATNPSFLRDVEEVLLGLERAKTAVRAMSKYVPVDLVRRLYQEGREPELGAISEELSVLFTDIRGFTSFAEQTTPDEVAKLLGLYLHAMTTVIQDEKGTIDKYIGDAVMAFWNAPEPVADHETLACRAALRSQDALRTLYTSASWGNAPRFETRFGLHKCTASVGHFGAPDRFNYTAIGDGINLASRLEGLNKYYGTTVIASESIHAAVKEKFQFRRLDRVAVKGKTEGLLIYELLSEKEPRRSPSNVIISYERAFDLYQDRHFGVALDLLERQPDDPPSAALAQRCRDLIAKPPHHSWDGIHVFDSK